MKPLNPVRDDEEQMPCLLETRRPHSVTETEAVQLGELVNPVLLRCANNLLRLRLRPAREEDRRTEHD
jgi:hypothetical protein